MTVVFRLFPNWLAKGITSKKIVAIFLSFLLLCLAAVFREEKAEGLFEKTIPEVSGTKTVVIDPGHGGADPGAVVGKITEADLNMRMSKAIKKKLEQNGIEVMLTRQDNTGLVPVKRMSYFERWLILEKRKQFAEVSKADVLISIHTNSNEDKTISGPMVFFSDPWSKTLAETIQRQLHKPGAKFKKVYPSDFNVIKNNKMPSVLIEAGFITNRRDRNKLLVSNDNLAEEITLGILEFLKEQEGIKAGTGGAND